MKKKRKKKKSAKKKPTVQTSDVKVTPYPTAGAKVTDFEQKLDEQLAGGETQRGPGRPRKQVPEPGPQPEALPVSLIANIIKTPFELWSISQSVKELALDDRESIELAESVKVLLDYYLPKIPPIAYAWISLSVTGFWIMRTRLVLIAELKKQKHTASSSERQADQRKDPGQGGPGPQPKTEQMDSSKFPTNIEIQKI